jgi:hypothetical protein
MGGEVIVHEAGHKTKVEHDQEALVPAAKHPRIP